ncbi:hypothetical protein H9Q73_006300, partial [Fusarium xylarioides]
YFTEEDWVSELPKAASQSKLYKQLTSNSRAKPRLHFGNWIVATVHWQKVAVKDKVTNRVLDMLSYWWGEKFPGIDAFFPTRSMSHQDQLEKLKGDVPTDFNSDFKNFKRNNKSQAKPSRTKSSGSKISQDLNLYEESDEESGKESDKESDKVASSYAEKPSLLKTGSFHSTHIASGKPESKASSSKANHSLIGTDNAPAIEKTHSFAVSSNKGTKSIKEYFQVIPAGKTAHSPKTAPPVINSDNTMKFKETKPLNVQHHSPSALNHPAGPSGFAKLGAPKLGPFLADTLWSLGHKSHTAKRRNSTEIGPAVSKKPKTVISDSDSSCAFTSDEGNRPDECRPEEENPNAPFSSDTIFAEDQFARVVDKVLRLCEKHNVHLFEKYLDRFYDKTRTGDAAIRLQYDQLHRENEDLRRQIGELYGYNSELREENLGLRRRESKLVDELRQILDRDSDFKTFIKDYLEESTQKILEAVTSAQEEEAT